MNFSPTNLLASANVPAFLWDAVFKSTVVFAAAWLLAVALRHRSAAARGLVWSLAIVASLAIPLLSLGLPGWPVLPAPAAVAQHQTTTTTPGPFAELPATPLTPPRQADVSTQEAAIAAPLDVDQLNALSLRPHNDPDAVSPLSWLVGIWLVGTAFALLPLVGGWLQLRRLRLGGSPITSGRTHDLLRQLAGALGLRRLPLLVESGQRAIPMTWGLLRPIILLPAAAHHWPQARLRVVLLHELAHIQRRDCLTQCLAQVARAVYWFNPLAWLAHYRLRLEQEQACDDRVLNAGHDGADYAEHLLAITTAAPAVPQMALSAAGRFRQVQRRLKTILDGNRDRRPLTRSAMSAIVVAALLILPVACLRLEAAEPDGAGEKEGEAPAAAAGEKDAATRLAEVRKKLIEHHVGPADEKRLTEGAIRGMVGALGDIYTEYLDPDKHAELKRSIEGALQGIGVMLEVKGGQPVIITPLAGSPALKAGLRSGDVIVAVDDKPAKDVPLALLVTRIAGPAGTAVKLKYLRDGRETEVSVTRAAIKLETVSGFRRGADEAWEWMLDAENKIGYVQVAQFGPDTPTALGEALKRLKEQEVKGLILDLRFCPGGLLTSAIESSRLLLAEGNIVIVKQHKSEGETHKAEGKAILADVPLVVLINDQTASAAEVVAGALKDNRRAVMLGTRTYGKGSVQSLVNIEGAGVLKVTTAHYQLPSGGNIDRRPGEKTWGVDPDDGYYLPLSSAQTEALTKQRQERKLLPTKAPGKAPLTAKVLGADHADRQLAAALTTTLARLKTGVFSKVGKSTRELLEDISRGLPLRQRREALLKEIEKLDRELEELTKGKPEAPPK